MNIIDWRTLRRHNASPRRPFGPASAQPRRRRLVGALVILAIYGTSAAIAGAVLWTAVRYALAAGWPL